MSSDWMCFSVQLWFATKVLDLLMGFSPKRVTLPPCECCERVFEPGLVVAASMLNANFHQWDEPFRKLSDNDKAKYLWIEEWWGCSAPNWNWHFKVVYSLISRPGGDSALFNVCYDWLLEICVSFSVTYRHAIFWFNILTQYFGQSVNVSFQAFQAMKKLFYFYTLYNWEDPHKCCFTYR